MIKMLITFDYELPLGGADSYDKALFDPANKIIELGNKLNVPLVFFTDVCSAIKFRKWDNKGYYQPFVNQMKKAISHNHDVQLHLHPHWLTTEFKNNTFIPSKYFSLSDFIVPRNSYTIDRIIEDSVNFLYDLCSTVDPNYKCVAYRAGGYRISDATEQIISGLIDKGVLIDSSYISGFFQKTKIFTTDFKKVKLNSWYISPTEDLSSENGLLEIPISSMPVSLLAIGKRRLKKVIYKNKIKQRTYNNTGASYNTGKTSYTISERMKTLFNPMKFSFDSNHYTLNDLEKILLHNMKQFKNNNSPYYITIISHPKSMGDYHINLMGEFISLISEKYSDQVEFTTYQKIVS